jgi:hypothetical protein
MSLRLRHFGAIEQAEQVAESREPHEHLVLEATARDFAGDQDRRT